jgi:hypothetical protein
MALNHVTLDDKYDLSKSRIFVTGFQAIVRLCLMQKERDRRAGLNTAGYVTGYRGSPLGTLDLQFIRAQRALDKYDVRFQAGGQRGHRRHRDLGLAAGRVARRGQGSMACSGSGTARDRASTAPGTSSATPISPAPRSMAASWR